MSSKGFDPKGKCAIVTGGAQGLGLEYARRLVDAGAKVCIADLNPDVGEDTVQELRKSYGVGKER